MRTTLLAFAVACTGGDPGGSWEPPRPTDIADLPDDSTTDVMHADGVAMAFFLSSVPNSDTIDLHVQDSEWDGATFFFTEAVGDPPVGDYVYDAPSNSVRFLRYVPPAGSLVIARYTPRNLPPSR